MANKYEKTETELEFDELVSHLSNYWENIAINEFIIKRKSGEPLETLAEGLTSEQILKTLYEKGTCLFFKDSSVGYLALPAVANNGLNVYFKPTKFRAIGNGYNKEYDTTNSVLIRYNKLKKPLKPIIDYYCGKLADIELAKDLNRDATKTTYVFECTEDTVLSAKNHFKKIRASEPVIFKNKSRGEADYGVTVQQTGANFMCDVLEDDYHNYEARILTLLGLDNYVEDKKERVQSAEVESNQEYIISSFRSTLLTLQEDIEKVNKMFNLDLVVDYVRDNQIEDTDELEDSQENDEEVQDE